MFLRKERAGALVLLLLIAGNAFSQKNTQKTLTQKDIAKEYPDEPVICTEESLVITFNSVVDENKNSSLVIAENYKGSFFTPEEEYSKITSVFYDDFSKVKDITCKANGRRLPLVPLVNTNYQSEGIFHDDVKVCLFPLQMSKNNKYDVSYTKDLLSPRMLSKIYFHSSFPVLKKRIVFEVPDWVEMEAKEFNFEGYNITKKENRLPGKKYKEIIYEVEKLGHFPNENNSPNSAKFMPHMLLFVKSYTLPKKQTETIFKTHADIYSWCKGLVDEVQNEEESLKAVAKEIAGKETDSLKMMENVFYWTQDHVRYIAFEDGIMGYKPMSAKKVYNMLYGDCKGMANFMKTLLKNLGFDARLTWIGTTDIPYNNDLPSLAVYNHMICTVFFRGKKYFLDGTETFIPLNDYAERIQGRPVMIENGKTYITETIPAYTYERNKKAYTTELHINKNGDLEGKGNYVFNGEGKTTFLRRVADIKSENKSNAIKNYLKENNPNLEIKNFSTSSLLDRSGPLTLSCDVELKNSCYTTSNKEMIILPEKDFVFEKFEFDSLRKTDYEFDAKYYLTYTTKIHLPAGSVVKAGPKPVNVSNDDYEFSMKYETEGEVLKIVKSIIVKNPILSKKQFKKWNEDVQSLKVFYHEPVIVKLK
jgi:hypothetical protein